MRQVFFVLIVFICHGFHDKGYRAVNTVEPQDSVYNYRSPSKYGIGKFYKGREIAAIMSSGGSGWLDRSSRQEEENSDLAVEQMKFPPDAVVADLGAGTGYYTFKIAEKVNRGKVYAVEIQDKFIDILKERIADKKVNNVEVIKGAVKAPNLPANTVDYVLMVDVYHELEYPQEMLKSISECLRPGGTLILMEYRAEDEALRILPLHKTSVKQLKKELEANQFELSRQVDTLPIQHLLFFKKKM